MSTKGLGNGETAKRIQEKEKKKAEAKVKERKPEATPGTYVTPLPERGNAPEETNARTPMSSPKEKEKEKAEKGKGKRSRGKGSSAPPGLCR